MRTHASTHLILLLRPEQEDHALYLLSETLSRERFTIIHTCEETCTSNIAEPFTISYKEKRITLALSLPLTPQHIKEIADLVTTGLLSGFIIRGEIDLGGHLINTLGTLEDRQVSRSRIQGEQAPSEEETGIPHLSERDRYLLAVETDTTAYYHDALQREAFRRDEEQRDLPPEQVG